MAYNLNKAKVAVSILPKNDSGQTQLSLDTMTAKAVVDGKFDTIKLFENLKDESASYASETLEALDNRHVSKAFEDLYRRGVNPLRAEILLLSEIVPIGTGETPESSDTASINLNYGEGANIKVNQVMRLIDLQRVIRKTILKVSGDFLEEHVDVSNYRQKRIIQHMHDMIVQNSEDFVELGVNIEKMIDHLIELCSHPASSSSEASTVTQKNGPGKYQGGAEATTSAKIQNLVIKKKILSKSKKFTPKKNRKFKAPWQGLYAMVKNFNKSEKSNYLRALARFVIYDYVTQNSIAFITRVYDLKELLKESISIGLTELPEMEQHGDSSNIQAGSLMIAPARELITPGMISGISVSSTSDQRILSAGKLLRRWAYPTGTSPDNFSSTSASKHSLVSVINVKGDSNEAEEIFGSNRHMYMNLFANLLESIMFKKSLSEDSNPKSINKKTVIVSQGNHDLAKAIANLKTITAQGFSSGHSPLGRGPSGNRLNGSKIRTLLEFHDSHDSSLVELVTAVCFDQAAGANLVGGVDKLMTPTRFDDFGKIDLNNNILIDFFNKAFFNTHSTSWESVKNEYDYEPYAKNESKLGSFMKARFTPINDDKQGSIYIPNEHSYEDNTHRNDSFLVGSDYFFSEAVASEELKFDSMRNEANRVVGDIDAIVHDIAGMLGLDFDHNGLADVGDLNLLENSANPLSYFYTMCEELGKDASTAAKNLLRSGLVATPLIEAGSFNDLNLTANVLKTSFFGIIATDRNSFMCINTGEGEDGKPLDPNLKNPEEAAKEIFSVFRSENVYWQEAGVWIKLFKGKLKKILKDGDSSKLQISELEYGASPDKKYNSLINNKKTSYGIGKLHNDKNEDGEYTWSGHTFGGGHRIDGYHPDYVEKRFNQGDTDEKLGSYLNIETSVEWLKLLVGIVGGAALGFFLLPYVAFYIAPNFMISNIILPAIIHSSNTVTAFLSVTTATGTAVGAFAARGAYGSKNKSARPSGAGFTRYGNFETVLLRNASLVPKEYRPNDGDGEKEETEKIQKAGKMLYGLPPGDIFFLKAKPNNGHKILSSWEEILDKGAEMLASFINNTYGSMLDWLGLSANEEGTVAEEDIHKPYFFKWNHRAGEFGGIFGTTTAQRYALFSLFFYRIYYKSLRSRIAAVNKDMVLKMYPACWEGMADALMRKPKNTNFGRDGKYSDLKTSYDVAYDETNDMMNQVRSNMVYRRGSILRNLMYLKQNASEIKEAVRRSENVLRGKSSEISPGENMALNFLRDIGFAKQGMSFLNDNTAGILMKQYQKQFLLDFRSDADESANPEGISVYPFVKKESYDIRDLKLMGKLFSNKGHGLTSHDEDNLGRKNIIHVGIPVGMIRALQNEAFRKTNEIEYYYSDNIVIHISKINDLDPMIKYNSRSYVFNMSKYVAPYKTSDSSYRKINPPGEFSLGNHLENYNDEWTLKDIEDNVEIMTAFRKRPLYAKGIDGIRLIDDKGIPAEAWFSDPMLDEELSSSIYQSMLTNHIYDYYSKLYVDSTTGFKIEETLFPLDKKLIFDGKVDPAMSDEYSKLVDELINRYPASNLIPDLGQEFYRVMKSARSSVYFSGENRYQACLGTQCFQRIFSIPFSERDFSIKHKEYNMDAEDIYKENTIPSISPDSKVKVNKSGFVGITGLQETFDNDSLNNLFNRSPARIIMSYEKTLNPDVTEVSSFLVEVALLKSSRKS